MSNASNPKRRVKVYLLNADGQWLDLGTGYVQVVFSEAAQETYFVVRGDVNPDEVILESRIFPDDIYQRQQDTLIVWQEPDTGRDIALSFQEAAGCVEIWDLLGVLRGSSDPTGANDIRMDLPKPAVENLSAIFDAMQNSMRNMSECDQLCHWLVKNDYYVALFDLFDQCEKEANLTALHVLFRIWRALLFCNNVTLLEVVLSEDFVLRFFGALEYDPRVSPDRMVKHREFLRQAQLKEVVPLGSDDLRLRIRQTYHIQYLRDVILAGVIDDGICSTINSFVLYNQMEIVSIIRRDPDVLQNLLRHMQDPEMSDEEFLEKCSFLLELCTLGKICNVAGRIELYSLLTSLGIFQVLELALRRSSEVKIRTMACEILNLTAQHNVSLLRNHVLNQGTKPSFLLLLVAGVVGEPEPGLKAQYSGILMALLDPEGMEKVNAKDKMLTVWYESCMGRLMEPLAAPVDENVATKEHVIDLLDFCIRYHDFRVKYFILGNNITKRVVSLISHRDRFLQLAAVRLIRVIVGIRDPFFDRHICRHHFLDPLVTLLIENKGADNLIDSAILEMIHFIRSSPIPDLAKELVSRHRHALASITYVSTASQLIQLVDGWEKAGGESGSSVSATPPVQLDSPTRKRTRAGDVEDSWFDEDDDVHPFQKQLNAMEHSSLDPSPPPNVMMDFSILPPLPSTLPSTRRLLDDEDDDLPLLNRHDTPPLLNVMPEHGSQADQQQPNAGGGISFASLKLPTDADALVAGLAAEATRQMVEGTPGGSFWGKTDGGKPLDNGNSAGEKELKRRKVPTDQKPDEETPTSLVDAFLEDAETKPKTE